MKLFNKEQLEKIAEDLETAMTLKEIAYKHKMSVSNVSNLRYQIDLFKAKNMSFINELYNPHELDGEELHIFLGIQK